MIQPKYFIITVDTEGECGWDWKPGKPVLCKNADYIERFQNLCQKYEYKPVYLVNYEMVLEDRFVEKIKTWYSEQKCEIGIHLHAWNNPPAYTLERKYNNQDYLIEYPERIMIDKFKVLYDLIKIKTGIQPVTHRAGRWAMNDKYFNILKDFGIKVDCSFTPGIDWSSNFGATIGGSDYSTVSQNPIKIGDILEVPMSIRRMHIWSKGNLKKKLKSLILGKNVWLRPATQSKHEMRKLIDMISKETDCNYLEFMVHSSELMPNGSPYFKTQEDIEKLYENMDYIFKYASQLGYQGSTLENYYYQH